MNDAALLAEIRQTESAKARASALLTTLYGCSDDDTVVTLRRAAEKAIEALATRLSALRYRLRHPDQELKQ